MSNITFNPMLTTTNIGGFSASSYGLVQGVQMDDPAVRFALAGGVLNPTEGLPMWGGVGIYADVAANSGELGPLVGRATTMTQTNAAGLIGFSVFNQAHHWTNWPQSTVPTGGAYQGVPYVPLGSGARLAVQIDPSLAASLLSNSIGQAVYWDFNAQCLVASASASYSVTSLVWSSTNGGQVTVTLGSASPVGGVGDSFTLAGVTNTGTGPVADINAVHQVNTWTSSQSFTFLLPGTSAMWGTLGGTITLAYSQAVLPCKILRVASGSSKVVNWDPVNLVANWNNSGSAALIQI